MFNHRFDQERSSKLPPISSAYPLGFQVPEVTPTDPDRDRTARRWIFGTMGVAGMGLVGYVGLMSLRPSITHYVGDDYSHSALERTAERTAHCQASLPHYQSGDRRVQIAFADIPEVVNDQNIRNTFLFDPCSPDLPPAEIGLQQGTSLIRVMERIALEVERERIQTPDRRVVVTLTLDHNEVMADQPALDETGMEQLQTAASTILGEDRGAIAIVGPGGELQNQLTQIFQTTPQVKICSFAAMTTCVDAVFSTVR